MYFKIQTVIICSTLLILSQSFTQDYYDTLFLKPGSEEGKDVVLRSIYPTINEGDHFDFAAFAWTLELEPFTVRSIIEFDLSEIPDSSVIYDAKLSLFYSEQTGGVGNSGDNASQLVKIIEEWDEHTVTWNTQPAVTFEDPVLLPVSTSQFQDYHDIDVTDLITDLCNYPELYHGFELRLVNEQYYRAITFASSDQANPNRWPELEVIYYQFIQTNAEFTYEIDEEFNVIFNNISQNYDSCYWDFGNGFYSNQENPVIQYAEEGVYATSLTVFNFCSQDTFIDTIFYCPEIFASYGYEVNGLQVEFMNYTENADSYFWDFDDGFMSTLENPIHTFNEYGDYYVCLTASNNCFEVIYCDTINAVQPGGIDEFLMNSIQVFPNPFQSFFKICNASTVDFPDIQITIIDSKGYRAISDILNINAFSEIEVSTIKLNPGVFILLLQSEELNVYKKLIKVNK